MYPAVNDTQFAAPYACCMLAHQGGWDEILLVLVPVGFIVFLLSVANRRAKKIARSRGSSPSDAPG